MSSITPQASMTTPARRSFLSGFGKFTLSATAIALLAGRDRLALIGSAEAKAAGNDVTILNAALAAEQGVVLTAPQMGERLDIRAPAPSTHWWRMGGE